jgi:hypothetical protein
MSTDPQSPDFSYNEYSLQQLDSWVHDAIGCETLTPQQIYDRIVKTVSDEVEYHASQLNRSADLLSLLKGNRLIEFDTSLDDVDATPDPMRKQVDLHKDQYDEILKFYRPKTHQEMLNDGWEMTGDGFWYKD